MDRWTLDLLLRASLQTLYVMGVVVAGLVIGLAIVLSR